MLSGFCPQVGHRALTLLPCGSRSGETRWPSEGVQASLGPLLPCGDGRADTLRDGACCPAHMPAPVCRGAALAWAVVTGRWSRPRDGPASLLWGRAAHAAPILRIILILSLLVKTECLTCTPKHQAGCQLSKSYCHCYFLFAEMEIQ